MSVITITKDNFKAQVAEATVPVLVDFWAPWCGPCRMLTPVVDEVAAQAQGFLVGKINIDDEADLAKQFGIMTIPTLLVFKNGEVAAKHIGLAAKQAVLDLVQSV